MKRPWVVALSLVWLSQGFSTFADEPLHFHLSPRGFVATWLVRGPFPNASLKERDVDYLLDQGGESKTPSLGEVASRAVGQAEPTDNSKWRVYLGASHLVNFAQTFRPTEKVLAYAYALIESEKRQPVVLKLGSDDGVKVWLNGTLIHDKAVYRGIRVDEDVVHAELRQGVNSVLVKVDQGYGDWGFCLRLTDPEGNPLSGMTVALPNFMGPEEIQNYLAAGVKVSAILRGAAEWKTFVFRLFSEISLPTFEVPLKVKVAVVDETNRVLAEVMETDLPAAAKEATWEPKGLAAGLWFLEMKVMKADGNELLVRRTPLFFW